MDSISRQTVRNQSINIIRKIKNVKPNDYDVTIKELCIVTEKFVNEHPEILITRADKGNVTVAILREEYNNKMETILSDRETYQIVKKDPSKTICHKLSELLSRWKKNSLINKAQYNFLLSTDGVLPRAYGLPKVHKEGHPLRIIVSSINSPLYNLANFLHNIMFKSLPKSNSFVKNSQELVKKLRSSNLESDYQLISLDVVSLFTNVPLELLDNSIKNRWNFISRGTKIPLDEFLIGVRLVLSSTFFIFNNVTYKQIYGTPMGSPLSPIVADLILQDLEEKALNSLVFTIPVYFRYVDDILLAAHPQQHDNILNVFNSLNNRLKFTIEKSTNNTISFLDVSVSLIDGSFIFDWYHKPTFSGRYLNFYSHHPNIHKKGVVVGLVDKVFNISDHRFFQKNLELAINILLDNNYPLKFIFSIINNRIKRRIFHDNVKDEQIKEKDKFFVVPYIRGISERFDPIAKELDYKIAFSCNHPLKKFIKTGKDQSDNMSQKNVVYKLQCNCCLASYVGQTKRQLKTRINEHRKDISKKNSASLSVISNHRILNEHDFQWDNVLILDRESSYSKRLTSEMLHIKKQLLPLNKQSDTDFLPQEYFPFLLS